MTLYEDNGPNLAACVITLTASAFLTYGLRLYCRVTQRTWGLEDWFMTGALVSNFIFTDISTLEVS